MPRERHPAPQLAQKPGVGEDLSPACVWQTGWLREGGHRGQPLCMGAQWQRQGWTPPAEGTPPCQRTRPMHHHHPLQHLMLSFASELSGGRHPAGACQGSQAGPVAAMRLLDVCHTCRGDGHVRQAAISTEHPRITEDVNSRGRSQAEPPQLLQPVIPGQQCTQLVVLCWCQLDPSPGPPPALIGPAAASPVPAAAPASPQRT